MHLHVLDDGLWEFGKHPHEEGKPLSRVMTAHNEQMTSRGIQGLRGGREGCRWCISLHIDGVRNLIERCVGEVLTANFSHSARAANESVCTLQAFHQSAQISPTNETGSGFTHLDGLAGQGDDFGKEVEKVVDVNDDRHVGRGGDEMSLFLIADKDEVNLIGVMQSLDVSGDTSRMTKPPFSQSLQARRVFAEVVFLNPSGLPTGNFAALKGVLQIVKGTSNA
jgi:hypothetical protein